ncbi:unnamed protein product [Staurois parvus]|uniref:Uncharacterized protein n=1 Tax=Staurois parvus TaxID=386267 RepID=A0ABN9HRN3_9NEOB|nr:unnamed protein product [Staurois parvus]
MDMLHSLGPNTVVITSSELPAPPWTRLSHHTGEPETGGGGRTDALVEDLPGDTTRGTPCVCGHRGSLRLHAALPGLTITPTTSSWRVRRRCQPCTTSCRGPSTAPALSPAPGPDLHTAQLELRMVQSKKDIENPELVVTGTVL